MDPGSLQRAYSRIHSAGRSVRYCPQQHHPLLHQPIVTPVANPYGEGQATATSDANGLVSFVGFEAKDYVIKRIDCSGRLPTFKDFNHCFKLRVKVL